MAESSTVEIEKKEEKPIENPLNNSNPVTGTAYSREVREWMKHNNKNSGTQDNNQDE